VVSVALDAPPPDQSHPQYFPRTARAPLGLYEQPLSESARARLKIIYENNDGFEIARQDLHLRGPGEFIGARQSGLPLLRFADLADPRQLEQARTAAETMLRDHPDLAQAHLARWLGGREEMLKA